MGKLFDILLLVMILLGNSSYLASVEPYRLKWAWLFDILEWIFTILFSVEYLLRIYSVKTPLNIFLVFRIIDLLSLIPPIGLGLEQIIFPPLKTLNYSID